MQTARLEMANTNSGACPYCASSAAERPVFLTFKHRWVRCTACGTMQRENRDVYPAQGLIAFLSKSAMGKGLADRLFKPFMRRRDREVVGYSNYGEE